MSSLGDWLNYVAVNLVIAYRLHLGAGALAGYAVALAIPYALLSPVAGVLVDRVPLRTVMIVCDVARAGVVLLFAFAPNVWVLFALVILRGTFSSVFNPAEGAAVRFAVPKDDLLAANSLNSLATQATKIIGPAIGGLIVVFSGPNLVFYIDAVSFLASASFLSGVRLPAREKRPRSAPVVRPLPEVAEAAGEVDGIEAAAGTPVPVSRPQGRLGRFLSEMAEGFGYVLRSRQLVVAIGGMAAAVFIVFTFDTLSPLALRSLGLGQSVFGVAIACVGAGAALGTVVVGQYGRRWQPFGLMGGGQAVAGGLVALIGLAVVLHFRTPASHGCLSPWASGSPRRGSSCRFRTSSRRPPQTHFSGV